MRTPLRNVDDNDTAPGGGGKNRYQVLKIITLDYIVIINILAIHFYTQNHGLQKKESYHDKTVHYYAEYNWITVYMYAHLYNGIKLNEMYMYGSLQEVFLASKRKCVIARRCGE